jgi:pimeloyl-ACP methyl ester carboxylesterase
MQLPDRIVNAAGERIACSFVPGNPARRDVVVIGHGLTSDRERPWSRALSEGLRERGVASLRIAFSGHGESEGRFEEATVTKQVSDLEAVVDALSADPPAARVHYVGHSVGGAVGLLAAERDERIRTLVSLAAVTHAEDWVRALFADVRPGQPVLGKASCPWSEALEADLVATGSLAGRAPGAGVPWLVVHGSADQVVPVQHSRDLAEASKGRAELIELEGVDHSFTGEEHLERLTAVVVPWLVERVEADGTLAD